MGYVNFKLFSFLEFLLTHLPLVSAPQEMKITLFLLPPGFLSINSCRKNGKMVLHFLYEAIVGFVAL